MYHTILTILPEPSNTANILTILTVPSITDCQQRATLRLLGTWKLSRIRHTKYVALYLIRSVCQGRKRIGNLLFICLFAGDCSLLARFIYPYTYAYICIYMCVYFCDYEFVYYNLRGAMFLMYMRIHTNFLMHEACGLN